ARELGGIMAAVGLASNLAAMRALATEGIQKGHMALHARAVSHAAGARGEKADERRQRLVAAGEVKIDRARELLRALEARSWDRLRAGARRRARPPRRAAKRRRGVAATAAAPPAARHAPTPPPPPPPQAAPRAPPVPPRRFARAAHGRARRRRPGSARRAHPARRAR